VLDTHTQLTIQTLYDTHHEKLGLEWIAGQQGGKHIIVPEAVRAPAPEAATDEEAAETTKEEPKKVKVTGQSLVGYLNLIHPHQIQILGSVELNYIEGLRDISRQDAIGQLFHHYPAAIIVADGNAVPVFLKRRCNENNTPLFSSPLPGHKLNDSLHYYLANQFADVITLHGVFMEVTAIGVFVTGPSGIGKSELALELISRGHRLVADDAPQFSRIAPEIINGSCPPALQDFLEVRGIGIINVRELFGDGAIKINKYLRLVVRLEPMDKEHLMKLDRLDGTYKTRKILDVEIPEITVPVTPGRNLAVLVECAARNHMLRTSGYSASEKFTELQQALITPGEK